MVCAMVPRQGVVVCATACASFGEPRRCDRGNYHVQHNVVQCHSQNEFGRPLPFGVVPYGLPRLPLSIECIVKVFYDGLQVANVLPPFSLGRRQRQFFQSLLVLEQEARQKVLFIQLHLDSVSVHGFDHPLVRADSHGLAHHGFPVQCLPGHGAAPMLAGVKGVQGVVQFDLDSGRHDRVWYGVGEAIGVFLDDRHDLPGNLVGGHTVTKGGAFVGPKGGALRLVGRVHVQNKRFRLE